MKLPRPWIAFAPLAWAALSATDDATAAAFTYQGRLDQNGAPKAGTVDLRFDAFGVDSGGAPLNAVPEIRDGVPLIAGVFTVEVDFGAGVFTGAPVFVQVGVREDAAGNAATLTGFTNLLPRQAVTATPYAQHAANVGADAVSSGQIANGSITASDANTTSASDGLQRRVSGSCATNSAIRVVNVDGTVECETDDVGSGAAAWGVSGNSGTDPATNFVGTTDAQPLELRANGVRVGRFEPRIPGPSPSGPNVVLGDALNFVAAGVTSATIAGGGATSAFGSDSHQVSGDFGTVGGGRRNSAGQSAVVAGGQSNTASGSAAFVGGGDTNDAPGSMASIAGGQFNHADGDAAHVGGGFTNVAGGNFAVIGGGRSNQASSAFSAVAVGDGNRATNFEATVGGGGDNRAEGFASTVPGGTTSVAGGDYSFAAGFGAFVRTRDGDGFLSTGEPGSCDDATPFTCGDEGTFVWADATGGTFASNGPNQFLIRAAGGVGIEPGNAGANETANVPEAPLHVFKGLAGVVSANANSIAVFENSAAAFVSVLAPAGNERGVLFGEPGNAQDGGVVYDSANRLKLRTGGNADRLVIDGDGDVGIGIGAGPVTSRWHVRDTIATSNNTPQPSEHAALIENNGSGLTNFVSVLALRVGQASPDGSFNFATFYEPDGADADAFDDPIGSIEGNGSGGVAYGTSGADYAEWLPRVDSDEAIAPGDLVGLHDGGKVSKRLDGAIRVLIASTGAAVAGNSPGENAPATHTLTAFVGQVQARVCGPVRAGDAIVATENGSGCGIARAPAQLTALESARVAGTAWESADDPGEHRVRVGVGLGDYGAERAQLLDRIAALEQIVSRLAAEVARR